MKEKEKYEFFVEEWQDEYGPRPSEYVPGKKKQKNPLIWKDTCTPELIPALFTVAKIRKQPA